MDIDPADLLPIDEPAPGQGEIAGSPRLDEDPRPHGFDEHLAALEGEPLDSVQLLLRSQIPEREMPEQDEVAAAVVKSRYDLHFWRPMIPMGLRGEFSGHLKELREDLELLARFRPAAGRPVLARQWALAREELLEAVPGAEVTRRGRPGANRA